MRGWLSFALGLLVGCESSGPAGPGAWHLAVSTASIAIDDEVGSVCVTKTDGRARCWNSDGTMVADLTLPDAHYVRVQRTGVGPIGLTDDGRMFGPRDAIPDGLPPIRDFRATNLWGHQGMCLMANDGSLLWGDHLPNGSPDGQPPRLLAFDPGPVVDVACAYEGLTCAVRDDGTVFGGVCPPGDGWAQVSISVFLTCGLTRGGDVVCSPGGHREDDPVPVFNEGPYTQLATAYAAACALDARGKLTCIRADGAALTVPAGPYVSIVAGRDLVCGIRPDGAPACFRQNEDAGAIGDRSNLRFTAFGPVAPPIDLDW